LLPSDLNLEREEFTMTAQTAPADASKLDLPTDLLHALQSGAHQHRTDYRIEALKPSLLGRLMEKLIGPRS
jgi:hypothetical protein